jgi:DNA-binding Lrp family transcriptional regulator
MVAVFDIRYGGMVEISDLDRQIAHCLAVDGRASFSQIADVIGVSDQTVARRYRRLRAEGALRVVGLRARQSMASLGWLLRIRCLPGSGPAIAEALARRPDTAWVQLLSGDTEVTVTVRGAAAERDAVLARLPRGGRIVAVSAHRLLHVFGKPSAGVAYMQVLRPEAVKALEYPVNPAMLELSDLDLALFRELGVDGRMSHADLAKAVGWSESSVRRRIDQLRDTGMLMFDLEVDSPTFGFHAVTWLWISVPPSRLTAAGDMFAAFPEVAYTAAITGAFSLIVCAVCRDEEELYSFLTARVGSVPSVERMETSPIIRTLKQSSQFLPPGPGQ